MSKIVELDNHFGMSAEETLVRTQREELEKVIVVGQKAEGGLIMFVSDMTTMETYWALKKAVQAVFDG